MRYKTLIAFVVGLCVLLAPVLSNASVPVPTPMAHTQIHLSHDHVTKVADCHTSADGVSTTSTQVTHGCCFNFVGILSAVNFVAPHNGIQAPIPFQPSLSPTSRAEGLYRPPRKTS